MKTNGSALRRLSNDAFRAIGKSLSSGRLFAFPPMLLQGGSKGGSVLASLLAIVMVVGTGTAVALEWSEPIQLTHHNGEYMDNSGDGVLIDANGLIHLQYTLVRAQEQEGNIKKYHTICDRDGQIIVGPTAMEFDSGLVSKAVNCETIDGNIAMIGTRPNSVYWFMIFDDSTRFVVEPHRINILSNPWWGNGMSLFRVEHDLKRNSDGSFVFFWPGTTRFEDSVLVYAITYARLSPDGHGIDSVHVVDCFDVVGFPTERGSLRDAWFEIDSEDNIYIVYNVAIWNTWTVRITKISPDDEVLFRDVRTVPLIESCESYMALDFTLDAEGNLYIPIVDMADSAYLHLQKLNSGLEVVSDIGLNEINLLSNRAKISIHGNLGGMIYSGSRNPNRPQGASTFVSFNTDSDTLDSTEYPVGTGYQYVSWFEDEFYSIFYHLENGGNSSLKMVKGTLPNSVENGLSDKPQLLSLLAYPNPFNNGTIITYSQPDLRNTRFQIFDHSGRILREITAQSISGSAMKIYWDGRDSEGSLLPSGSYFLRVNQAGERSAMSRQLTIIR